MTSHSAHRAGRQQAAAPAHHVPSIAPIHHAPNAALLIDFDNVTLGIRSDLAKELRTLLNSDIIKGKVAVQRAYADWRRYPQHIVSLSESSIDLIFAPAFGTAKKNATDIRLAVDAIELVFTRPEIGTFMLLSGDSDFSSLVLKLKEYGKYVIGVGIRESASDILIQNCDEYYSYSDLAGLSKEADSAGPPRDPWELVTEAVQQMVRNGDVMRADRLKQVMQQIDPAFDEGAAGYSRFSKFVTEAGTRGLIKVIKQENGQLDIAPVTSAPARGGSGRGAAPAATAAEPAEGAARGGRHRRGGRGRSRGGAAEETPAPRAAVAAAPATSGLTLAEAFHLLSRSLGELPAPVQHEALRARMAVLHGKEDPLLDADRFGKLLRQANDAEVADVRMVAENQYEVSPHKADLALQMSRQPEAPAVEGAAATARPTAALRFRGGSSRSTTRPPELQMVGVIDLKPALANTVELPIPTVTPSTSEPDAAEEAEGEVPGRRGNRRGKRGGKRHRAGEAAVEAAAAPSNAPVVAPEPATTGGAAPRASKGAKRSPRRTSKPLAG
ncbi:MAG TPA: NYN domain-containing protein [Gemmatimonadales bacterium]